ncbi:MAG: fibronectin type III domain-containing protein, partial [Pseudomonadota bacterium]
MLKKTKRLVLVLRKTIALSLPVQMFFLMLLADCHAASIIVQWNKSSGATGYILFWGEQSVLPPSTPASQQDVTGTMQDNGDGTVQYTLLNLVTGHTYYFSLKAYNANGQSDFSEQKSITISNTTTTSAQLTSTT